MKEFLKSILKKDHSTSSAVEPEPSQKAPFISNWTVTKNNVCETVFEGSFTIPQGNTASVTGTLVDGFAGGGLPGENGAAMILGTAQYNEGKYFYSVNLGNSDNPGNATSYTLRIELSNGKSAIKLFERTSFHSSMYDTQPC